MPTQKRKGKGKLNFNPFENNKKDLINKVKQKKTNTSSTKAKSKAPRRAGNRGS